MNSQVISFALADNYLERTADYICSQLSDNTTDLSTICCVFGGRRPMLFLRRALARRIKKCFIPPAMFSIDEFIDFIVLDESVYSSISMLDAWYEIYLLAKREIPAFVSQYGSFKEFLPWAREIGSFIEQLDLEMVSEEKLIYIERSAQIGYDIPDHINHFLACLSSLRNKYHHTLTMRKILTRGMKYLRAAQQSSFPMLDRFRAVLFCNFFFLHETEKKLFHSLYSSGKGVFVFQGDQTNWSVLRNTAQVFNQAIVPGRSAEGCPEIFFYRGFDLHSQIVCVRHILTEKIVHPENTVIVLPRPEAVIPLVTEISSLLDEYNVSLGYPLQRTSLYTLLYRIIKAQESKQEERYYAKDYLELLRHPLVKTLQFQGSSLITRFLIHALEERFEGVKPSMLNGVLFFSLDDLIHEDFWEELLAENSEVYADRHTCKMILKSLHDLFFHQWETIGTFAALSRVIEEFLSVLAENSSLEQYSVNIQALEKLQDLAFEFDALSFSQTAFAPADILGIFHKMLTYTVVAFHGSPLRGTQILGLFETRSLNFDHVVIMDMNESFFPHLKLYEPLIPRQIMVELGVNRLEKEEEIQKYQFSRLIASAKTVHLIYQETPQHEKSRFIEQLVWSIQKKKNDLDVISIPKIVFPLAFIKNPEGVAKRMEIIDFLKNSTFSASKINTYLRCPLRFYFQYVLGLSERVTSLDEPDARQIGTFIHELLEESFREFLGAKPQIDKQFRKKFFERFNRKFEKAFAKRMHAEAFLLKHIMETRLQKFLEAEEKRSVDKIIALEQKRSGILEVGGERFNFEYIVDRIDQCPGGEIVVVDYKTGGSDMVPKGLAALQSMELSRLAIRETIKSFQLPLYHYFVCKEFPKARVDAMVYNIRTLEQKSYISDEEYDHKDIIEGICVEALGVLFREMFDIAIPFTAEKSDDKVCKMCSFQGMCV